MLAEAMETAREWGAPALVQRAMATSDALLEYLQVDGSALYAVPAGVGEGEYVGQALFA